jgi:hypothetical protein
MAASSNLDNSGIQTLRVPDFRLGINTAVPPTEIQDAEVQDLLNFEFDDNGNLSTRRGATQLSADTFSDRITSLHYYTTEAGEIGILFTTGTTLRLIETNGTGLTTLSGALTLPDDTFWSWVTFDGIAIGANKATSGDNPVKVDATSTAAALGGSPPKAKYLEVWENRLWLVSASEPNQIWGSVLGDPEDWTVTAGLDTSAVTIDIDADDGDLITGIFATRDALYIFKRRSIHRLVPLALPATDPDNLKREIVTREIGCVSHYSITQVLDDVLFLSDQGIASLSLVVTAENFKTAFYSRNVAEITNFVKSTEEIPAFLFDTAAQYWLSLPADVAPNALKQVYVMDYLKVNEGYARWTRFDGMVAGTAYTAFQSASGKTYVIGALNSGGSLYQLFTYIPRSTSAAFSDQGPTAYTKAAALKSFNGGAQLLMKHWHEWGLGLNLLSSAVGLTVSYYFDQNINRTDSYSFGLTGTTTGSLWAGGLWGAGLWGTTFSGQVDIVRQLKSNDYGRESQDITFNFSNAQAGEGFTIQDFELSFIPLSNRRVSDV